MKNSKLLLISLSLLALLLGMGPASAGLRVDGAVFEEVAAPGQHVSHEAIVSTKTSDSPLDMKVKILGYGQTEDGSSAALNETQDTSLYSARPFLKATPESFHLEPGESKSVVIDGTIPSDAAVGGRYAIINILSAHPSNNSVGINVAINIPVRLTVNGTGVLDAGEISNLTLREPISGKEQNVSFIFKNTGNHHYKFQAEAIVKDSSDRIVANATAKQAARSVPSYSRKIELKLIPAESLPDGTYNLTTTVKTDDGTILASKETTFDIFS
ncbi:MAG: hypothetical protein EHM14_01870 [Methanothrix sp.]|nr:MAG: hypothetical protein EHM14_01870 [Methanothrix sp.]